MAPQFLVGKCSCSLGTMPFEVTVRAKWQRLLLPLEGGFSVVFGLRCRWNGEKWIKIRDKFHVKVDVWLKIQ